MSRIRTNVITNRMANGAPTVSNGLVISGVTTTSEVNVGAGVTLNVYGGATFSGIITASSFKGDGSQLSNITSTTINNNADNRIITGSGTANTLEGESGLTYSSNTLDVNNAVKLPDDGTVHFGVSDTAYVRGKDSTDGYVKIGTVGAEVAIFTPEKTIRTNQCPALETTAGAINITGGTSGGRIALQGTTTSAGAGLAEIFAFWGTNKVAGMLASSGSDTTNKDDGQLLFYTSASGPAVTERLRIHSDGRIQPKYPSSAGATGGIIMVGGFAAQPSAHAGEGVVQAKTNTNANCFDAGGWYNNSTYRYTPQVKGHYIFYGTGMMYTGMNGSSCEQSVYFVKNNSAGSGNVPQYATGYSTNYGNYDLHHITNVIYMNGTTDYVHFHLSSNQSVQVHSGSMWSGFLLYPAA